MSKTPLFVCALILLAMPAKAQQLDENATEKEQVLSAANLCRLVGLEITETLVIGDIENVKNGKIPLAATIPTTIASIEQPKSVSRILPPAKNRSAQLEEFDADIFLVIDTLKPGHNPDEVYRGLFKSSTGRRPYNMAPILKPVCLLAENDTAATKKQNKKNTVRENIQQEKIQAQERKEQDKHTPRSAKFVPKTRGKKDYF